jgi:putative phage-type endonuclease
MGKLRLREGGELVMGKPKLLCSTKSMSRERWLECRAHGPDDDIEYAFGGSDVSVVFGESPWTTPLELYRIKKGLMKANDSANANQKEMGHLMEPIVAHWYGKLTGNAVMEEYGLFQHSDYPYALANLDYRVRDSSGANGVLECKTTSWHKAGDWADGAIPHYYELQVRFYMAVMDLEFADIACLWGTNPEMDMAIHRVHRDRDIEAIIFERLDEFIERLRTDNPPSMSGVAPELALKALAAVYGASQPGQPTIEFGMKFEKPLRRIAALQESKVELDRQVRENEKEAAALSVKIAEIMGTHEHGVLDTAADQLVVDFITKSTRRVDSDLLKKSQPHIYNTVLKTCCSRKVKVSVKAK